MSRIGKLPVVIPDKVEVKVDNGATVHVKGPKGSMTKSFKSTVVAIAVEDGAVVVSKVGTSREAKAMYGTARSIINGMVEGVTKGFEKNLIINGVGFKAAVQGQFLDLALGYSHPIKHPIPDGHRGRPDQGQGRGLRQADGGSVCRPGKEVLPC
jgi:large subunit ribosomal protein L6